MNTFVIILLGLLGIIVLLLIIAAFIKQDYAINREIIVNKPKQQVFNYIKYLKNQNNYSKWATMDPNMKTEFRGTDGTIGFVSGWDSNQKDVGKGEQEIKKITEGESVVYEIRFERPFKSVADAFMKTESVSDTNTKVTWGFNGNMKYPMNLMLLFMKMDEMIGNDLNIGLTRLKELMEKQ